MITKDPVHRERVFLICYYLSDDSMSVYEQEQKNSGKGVQLPLQMLLGLEVQIFTSPAKC